jgi:hypothetical protein
MLAGALRTLVVFSTVVALSLAQQPPSSPSGSGERSRGSRYRHQRKGKFIPIWNRGFQDFDQARSRPSALFNRERNQRVVVGFLVDLSNQSRGQWKSLQEATVELVLNLLPGDKKYAGYLIGYGNEAELMVNTTSDPDPIVQKLGKFLPAAARFLRCRVPCLHQPKAGGRRACGSPPRHRRDRRRP